jgi:hypothetical protein
VTVFVLVACSAFLEVRVTGFKVNGYYVAELWKH